MRLSGLTLVVAAVLSLTEVQAQGLTPLQPSSVNGVSQSMPVSVQTYTAPDGRVFVMVGPMMMELKSHSVRSPKFQLLV